jgi:hypothetical protein
VNGEDDTVVFDRRGSKPIIKSDLIQDFSLVSRGGQWNFDENFHQHDMKCKVLALEAGQKVFIFRMKNATRKVSPDWFPQVQGMQPTEIDYIYDADFELLGNFWNYTYRGPGLEMCEAWYRPLTTRIKKWNWEYKDPDFSRMTINDYNFKLLMKQSADSVSWNRKYEEAYPLPILVNSGLPSIIPAEDVYQGLEQYFSSKSNDVSRESDGLKDVEKAVNHGFDKKTSFRNPTRTTFLQ